MRWPRRSRASSLTDSLGSWPRASRRPLILGHRGTNLGAPENTLRAFETALALGADGVELDVRLSADAQPVVIHDADLKRVTFGRETRRVAELSLSELARLELAEGQRIPTLAQVLAWAEKRAAHVNVELKSDSHGQAELVEAVRKAIRAGPAPKALLLSSFDLTVVELALERLGGSSVAWLVDTPEALQRATLELSGMGVQRVNPDERLLTPGSMRQLQRHRLSVGAWTVNSTERARELAGLGVESIITDRPGPIAQTVLGRGHDE